MDGAPPRPCSSRADDRLHGWPPPQRGGEPVGGQHQRRARSGWLLARALEEGQRRLRRRPPAGSSRRARARPGRRSRHRPGRADRRPPRRGAVGLPSQPPPCIGQARRRSGKLSPAARAGRALHAEGRRRAGSAPAAGTHPGRAVERAHQPRRAGPVGDERHARARSRSPAGDRRARPARTPPRSRCPAGRPFDGGGRAGEEQQPHPQPGRAGSPRTPAAPAGSAPTWTRSPLSWFIESDVSTSSSRSTGARSAVCTWLAQVPGRRRPRPRPAPAPGNTSPGPLAGAPPPARPHPARAAPAPRRRLRRPLVRTRPGSRARRAARRHDQRHRQVASPAAHPLDGPDPDCQPCRHDTPSPPPSRAPSARMPLPRREPFRRRPETAPAPPVAAGWQPIRNRFHAAICRYGNPREIPPALRFRPMKSRICLPHIGLVCVSLLALGPAPGCSSMAGTRPQEGLPQIGPQPGARTSSAHRAAALSVGPPFRADAEEPRPDRLGVRRAGPPRRHARPDRRGGGRRPGPPRTGRARLRDRRRHQPGEGLWNGSWARLHVERDALRASFAVNTATRTQAGRADLDVMAAAPPRTPPASTSSTRPAPRAACRASRSAPGSPSRPAWRSRPAPSPA